MKLSRVTIKQLSPAMGGSEILIHQVVYSQLIPNNCVGAEVQKVVAEQLDKRKRDLTIAVEEFEMDDKYIAPEYRKH